MIQSLLAKGKGGNNMGLDEGQMQRTVGGRLSILTVVRFWVICPLIIIIMQETAFSRPQQN